MTVLPFPSPTAARPEVRRTRKRIGIGFALLGCLSVAGLGMADQLEAQRDDMRAVVETASAEIRTCALSGVGATMSGTDFGLGLPSGCRLAR